MLFQIRWRPGQRRTNVRALGSYIKGTNGKSQGVVPFPEVVKRTAVAVTRAQAAKGRRVRLSGNSGTWTSKNSSIAQENRRDRPPPPTT